MFNAKNSKKQGDIGLGSAIAYYTSLGYTVSVPLTDSQAYDLIIDTGRRRLRVQVKTSSYRKHKNFIVSLTIKGGNRSWHTTKPFDPKLVDQIFVLTADQRRFVIPAKRCGNSITLQDRWEVGRAAEGA